MNSKQIVSVIASGTLEVGLVEEMKKSDMIIAADYAAYWLLSHNIISDMAIGDFDSVTTDQLDEIKEKISIVLPFSPHKDQTDFELAIEVAMKHKPVKLKIFGISGTRFDHQLASIGVLEKVVKRGIEIEIFDSGHHMIMGKDREIQLTKSREYTYFSIIPLSSAAVVSISGCVYPVKKKVFRKTESLGVSNEIQSDIASIQVHKGVVLVIESKD